MPLCARLLRARGTYQVHGPSSPTAVCTAGLGGLATLHPQPWIPRYYHPSELPGTPASPSPPAPSGRGWHCFPWSPRLPQVSARHGLSLPPLTASQVKNVANGTSTHDETATLAYSEKPTSPVHAAPSAYSYPPPPSTYYVPENYHTARWAAWHRGPGPNPSPTLSHG